MRYSKSKMEDQLESLSRQATGQVLGLVRAIQDRLVATSREALQPIADQVGLTITTLNEAADGTGEVEDAGECVCRLLEAMEVVHPEREVEYWLRWGKQGSRAQLCA